MNLYLGLLSAPENKNNGQKCNSADARYGAERPLADVSYNLVNRTHKGFAAVHR